MFKVAICDDEQNEAAVIKQLVEEFMKDHGILYSIQMFHSGEDLTASSVSFDFVFLDISMGGMNGIEAGMKLYQRNRKVRIIYITGFNGYCSDAINRAHAFAYLSKPVKKEQLLDHISELVQVIGLDRGNDIEIILSNVTEISESGEKEYPAIKVSVSKILYFEYVKTARKIRVKTIKKTYEYLGTMTDVEQRMEIYGFGTCYRGVIVNFEHVAKVKGDMVYLNTGERLPLSQKRVIAFKEQLNNYVHRSI
ncbi:MAG: LytTR family DNA-binding domain-containing protein [Hungatella sp.]|jgi:DNA-binding LytR/AlgR family response regulator|nr:LytTR family DNA-binding domain-containing protein [Hungatella sp.]